MQRCTVARAPDGWHMYVPLRESMAKRSALDAARRRRTSAVHMPPRPPVTRVATAAPAHAVAAAVESSTACESCLTQWKFCLRRPPASSGRCGFVGRRRCDLRAV
eukprot:357379-Chlamydomonas_euryale.AAC.1